MDGRRPGAAILACVAGGLAGCDIEPEATGERQLRTAGRAQVALVQAFVQRPPHFSALRHSVVCRSPSTASRRADARHGVPAGWALVGHLPEIERAAPTPAAQARALDAAEDAARASLAAGEGWLLWHHGTRVDMTFDDCATWGHFDPSESLPLHEIDMTRVKFRCDPSDCAGVALDLPDGIAIDKLDVVPPSRIAFTVRSAALNGSRERRVESRDGGRTWQVAR